MQGKPFFRVASAVVTLWLLAVATPSAWAQTAPGGEVDPVVADVVRMLDVGVEPALVLQWLESSGRRPAPLSADDVIALSQANAPKDVIQALLDMGSGPAGPQPAAPAVPGYSGPATPTGTYPVQPGGTTSPAPVSGDCCLVEVSIEYLSPEKIEGDNTAQPDRDLFVYVDGDFLARISPAGNIARRGPVGLKTQLTPGPHRIRLTRELHLRTDALGRDPAWDHETAVSPAAIDLQVDPGGTYNLDLRWVQGEFSLKRPLSWRWSKNGTEIAGEKRTGDFSEKWAFLCEDVEASRDTGAISDWRAKDRLKGCVRWSDLWLPGTATSRQDVLAGLQKHDFDPPVSYVGRLD